MMPDESVAAAFAAAMTGDEGSSGGPAAPTSPDAASSGQTATPVHPSGVAAGAAESAAASGEDNPDAPSTGSPEAVAAESDEELFGDVKLPWDEETSDLEELDESGDPDGGLTAEKIAEITQLMGDGSKGLSRQQKLDLHREIFVKTTRGRRYHEAFKTIRTIEGALGREIDSPDVILNHVRSARTLDEMVGALRAGPDGAKRLLHDLTHTSDGRAYPWAQHVVDAAKDLVGGEFEAARKSGGDATYSQLIDEIAERAAESYANGDKDSGNYFLNGLNVLHFMRHGKAHPQRQAIMGGRYERAAASADPAAPTRQEPEQNPDIERLRRENDQLRNGNVQSRLEGFGNEMDDAITLSAQTSLAPLKDLAARGVIPQHFYDMEVNSLFDRIMDSIGPQAAQLGRQVIAAVKANDAAGVSYLRKELQTLVGRAARTQRVEVLNRYREQIAQSNARVKETQARQTSAGTKTEAATPGSPSAPLASPHEPPGTVKGNKQWLKDSIFAGMGVS